MRKPSTARRSLSAPVLLLAAALLLPAAAVRGLPFVALDPRAGEPVPAAAQAAYERGLQALSDNDPDTAAAAFQAALDAAPNAARAMLGLAQAAYQSKRTEEAEAWLERALAAAPDWPDVQTSWGRFLAAEGRIDEAEAALRRAIELGPRHVAPYLELGHLYYAVRRDPALAAMQYREALALEPEHAGANFALGVTALESGLIGEAGSRLARAAELAPDNPLVHQQLGRLHRVEGRIDQALAAYDRALEQSPGLLAVQIERGDLLAGAGRIDEARKQYSAARTSSPDSGLPLTKLGMLAQQEGRPEAAEQLYREAIALDASQAIAYNNLAWLQAERRTDLDAALDNAHKALALVPDSREFADTLAAVHRARGEADQAARVLQEAGGPPQDAR